MGLLTARCVQLLGAGWEQVQVVTDHGWLLLPGGMPKVELPEHLTVVRKGRCARLKDSSGADSLTAPWHWQPHTLVALAPGITCFEANREYEHGGLSPQECVTPVLVISNRAANRGAVVIDSLIWTQLRCRLATSGAPDGTRVDLRLQPANADSSVLAGARPLDDDGRSSLLVEDEDLIGRSVYVVLVNPSGGLLHQQETVVGGSP